MTRYAGKRVVVTGAGSGIGAAIARAMAAEGGTVAVLDVDPRAAQTVAERCGAGAVAVECDVADPSGVAAAFARIDDLVGGVDVVVCNAGHAPPRDQARTQRALQNMQLAMAGQPGQALQAASSLTDAEWDRMIRVHLSGTFFCAREAMRRMEHDRRGVILTMASILGIAGSAAAPHYAAAKGGIIALTKSLAAEGAVVGVRVNAIAPGWIDTPMTQGTLDSDIAAVVRMQIPMHRFGTPDEIAALALHLCSDEASYTTGQVVSANGGLF